MLMNMTAVYVSLSATMFRKVSGQKALASGPPVLQRRALRAARRALSMRERSERKMASRALIRRAEL